MCWLVLCCCGLPCLAMDARMKSPPTMLAADREEYSEEQEATLQREAEATLARMLGNVHCAAEEEGNGKAGSAAAALTKAAKVRAAMLKTKLGSQSVTEYCTSFQEAQQAAAAAVAQRSPPKRDSPVQRAPYETPRRSKRSRQDAHQGDDDDDDDEGTSTPVNSATHSPSPSSPSAPLVKSFGRGRGRMRLLLVHDKSYVSQVFELQQAMGWPLPVFEHTRVG